MLRKYLGFSRAPLKAVPNAPCDAVSALGSPVKLARSWRVTPNRFRTHPQREHVLEGQINVRVSLAGWGGLLGRLVRSGQELEERRLGPEVVREVFDCRLLKHIIEVNHYASHSQGTCHCPS